MMVSKREAFASIVFKKWCTAMADGDACEGRGEVWWRQHNQKKGNDIQRINCSPHTRTHESKSPKGGKGLVIWQWAVG